MQSTSAVRRFDRDRFQRLLDLIGPGETAAFLTQLAQDLSGCGDAITRASVARDWATLREASHVLISLSGSVGAMSLQSLAEQVNAAARGDAPEKSGLLDDLDRDLSALLAVVGAEAANLDGPQ